MGSNPDVSTNCAIRFPHPHDWLPVNAKPKFWSLLVTLTLEFPKLPKDQIDVTPGSRPGVGGNPEGIPGLLKEVEELK
eukprot:1315970-Amorphochlora_amoeboformis.AAC.1